MNVLTNITEAEQILAKVRTHPEFSACLRREVLNYMGKEADRHSYLLEHDYGNGDEKNGRKVPKNGDGLRRIDLAWRHLLEEGISLQSLNPLGHILAPLDDKGKPTQTSFRFKDKQQASFGPKSNPFYGVPASAVHAEMSDLIKYLTEDCVTHPIIKAANVHMDIVRIHPYEDGNGRAARVLQNFVLKQRDYPPAVIVESELGQYLDLINGVWEILRAGGSRKKQEEAKDAFRSFIAYKVLESSRDLLSVLSKKRHYQVDLDRIPDKGIVYSLMHIIRRESTNIEGGLTVSFKDWHNRRGSFNVQGDISSKDLSELLEIHTKRKGFAYSVLPIVTC